MLRIPAISPNRLFDTVPVLQSLRYRGCGCEQNLKNVPILKSFWMYMAISRQYRGILHFIHWCGMVAAYCAWRTVAEYCAWRTVAEYCACGILRPSTTRGVCCEPHFACFLKESSFSEKNRLEIINSYRDPWLYGKDRKIQRQMNAAEWFKSPIEETRFGRDRLEIWWSTSGAASSIGLLKVLRDVFDHFVLFGESCQSIFIYTRNPTMKCSVLHDRAKNVVFFWKSRTKTERSRSQIFLQRPNHVRKYLRFDDQQFTFCVFSEKVGRKFRVLCLY